MPELESYRTERESREVVRCFESCEYRPEEFVHAKHLTVAAWYFLQFDQEIAAKRMRTSLMKFIRHHGKNGYHATITECWLRLVRGAMRDARPEKALVLLINEIVERFSDKGIIYDYFSRERLDLPEAKAGWLEPDLKNLPGIV